jgi:hypothetical protein
MARNSLVGYKGSLSLEKVTGIRHDLGQRMTNVKLKESTKLPYTTKSMKTSESTRWKPNK